MTSAVATRSGAPTSQRFQAVDAMRGLAALAVVLYHVQGAFSRGTQTWFPDSLRLLAENGHLGVNVFFVLSGFVIARSVRDGSMSLAYLGRFTLRRSIRLDPPYWSAIALELILIFGGLALFPSLGTPRPSGAQLLSHFVYLQDVLGFGHLVPIFWTLCYEIQFYLTFVGMLVLGQFIARRIGHRAASITLALLFSSLFVASLCIHRGVLSNVHRGIGLDRWYEFFTGVAAWWVLSGTFSPIILTGIWGLDVAAAKTTDSPLALILVVGVSAFCLCSARFPSFDRYFRARPLQFLGTISYSLYLYHASIGYRMVSLAQHYYGMSLPAAVGATTWVLAVGTSVLIGWLGWRTVERPSLRLSKRVALPTRGSIGGTTAHADAVVGAAARLE